MKLNETATITFEVINLVFFLLKLKIMINFFYFKSKIMINFFYFKSKIMIHFCFKAHETKYDKNANFKIVYKE